MKQYALARPYTKAAFQFAKEHKKIAAWAEFLAATAKLLQDPQLSALLKHPQFKVQDLFDIILERQPEAQRRNFSNFLQLLVENRRLSLLPDIAELFLLDVKAENAVRTVTVQSAMPLSDVEIKTLETNLQQQFAEPVELTVTEDPSLIGGVMIKSGDYVIDASLKGQLQRLKKTLTL